MVLSIATEGSEVQRQGYPVLELELGQSMAGRTTVRRVESYLGGGEGRRVVELDEEGWGQG